MDHLYHLKNSKDKLLRKKYNAIKTRDPTKPICSAHTENAKSV